MNRIVVSAGEPGGIGPDLCLQFAMQAFPAQWVAAGDPNLFAQRATLLGLRLDIKRWTPDSPVQAHQAGTLQVWDVVRTPNNTVGAALAANAHYVLDVLRLSTQACLDQVFDALVTGPVQKSSINEAGIPFSGHTEYLAELTNTDQPVMMLATEGLRVALLTTHVPIAEVPKLITRDRMESVVKILHHDLRENFGVENPRILVCGLNPHAGEDGHCGREEIEHMIPAMESLKAKGMHLTGPLPADTLFTPKYLKDADAVLAMFHDQGLPVLKYKGFGNAINVTLGLPIVRTSVDHGTALSLAGKPGLAEGGSFALAMHTALEMVEHRKSLVSHG